MFSSLSLIGHVEFNSRTLVFEPGKVEFKSTQYFSLFYVDF